MRNRFLILGLTGPLGSGCTTTAKFLSGSTIDGKNFTELLLELSNDDFLDDLDKRISRQNNQIKKLTDQISVRLNKPLGIYKNEMIDFSEDLWIKDKERKLKYTHQQLAIYHRRRLTSEVLKDFTKEQKTYLNISEKERQLFGFSPFVYISFTTIIMKLAIESFFRFGKQNCMKYFEEKIKANDEDKKELDKIRKIFINEIEMLKNSWSQYKDANQFIKERHYEVGRKFHKYLDPDTFESFNKIIQKSMSDFYDFISSAYSILYKLKAESKTEEYSKALSEVLQDWGDNIRATGNPFNKFSDSNDVDIENIYTLSKELNVIIKLLRFRIRFIDNSYKILPGDNKLLENAPAFFVVECFRNPFEVDYFKVRYSEFYLLSIQADEILRKQRVKYFSDNRDKRDQGKTKQVGDLFKLDVRSCVLNSDIALINNKSQIDYLKKLLRYFALIREPGCISPTDQELNMHLAYSMSLMSTCISRKVGAVIIGPKGYILGAGWNDVNSGKIGCGLRNKRDYLKDEFPITSNEFKDKFMQQLENFTDNQSICYKDIMSKLHLQKQLSKAKIDSQKIDEINDIVSIKRLEFCRALHAEENAILQIANVGGNSIAGSSIYTTTFPCELCAKKIYQTGIKTIYYTEPYPDSISEEVFLKDGYRKIEILPFEGVKSNCFYKLFKPVTDKKDYQIINSIS